MPVSKSRPVPAFYDGKPNLLPVLSSQVEIAFLPGRRVRISASESMTVLDLDFLLDTRGEKIPRTMTSRAMTPTVTTSRVMTPRAKMPRAVTPRAQSPTGQMPAPTAKGKLVTIEAPSSDSERSESSPAPSKSSLSTLESELGGNDKISKPSGEAGRPGHGGYNLEEQLGWGDDWLQKSKDVTKCRSQQHRRALDTVCDLAVAEFPDLSTFENCWPVLDLIQMRLKYLSSRAQQEKRIADGSSEAAKGGKRIRGRSPKSKSPGPSKK
ncbi:hypothetical protein EV401DRAFT_1891501 [Pisolithus croceorrhizus]|nr:hypothetical protein EV401DRAFT_1891501 [Pisolithus croceorrhizus]